MDEKHKLNNIQQIELQALQEILGIAKQQGWTVFLRGGSVMGAIKYQGFVPWDDDMDIALPRADYNALIKLLSSDWSQKFWMASYKKGDQIHTYFPRIMVKRETLKEQELPTNNDLGLTIIDILPLDGVPSTKIGRLWFALRVVILRALDAVWTLDAKKNVVNQKRWKDRVIKLLKFLRVNKFYTQNQIYDLLDKIYSKREVNQSAWIGTITGSLFAKELFPNKIWGEGRITKFEDIDVKVPYYFDTYLKQLYGNSYMLEEPIHKKSHLEGNIKRK
ncbi:LICD family protein [Oenococcus oeni]|uniref:LicD family protein n=1 Tax=Oenococcus oeni TaxID=1247 RepID=UPI0010B660B2|nr:LicD family protein [Oenococcus oeni]SYW12243.1 LICD family protein [Oenococcus oeni]